jgi:hypothetical protein
MESIKLLSAERSSAKLMSNPTTDGTRAIPSGTLKSVILFDEKPMTPVAKRSANVTTKQAAAGVAIFIHNGHFNTSIFLILLSLRASSPSSYSSCSNVCASGVRSSMRTFIALRIAIS